jgi:hypothetical protein
MTASETVLKRQKIHSKIVQNACKKHVKNRSKHVKKRSFQGHFSVKNSPFCASLGMGFAILLR